MCACVRERVRVCVCACVTQDRMKDEKPFWSADEEEFARVFHGCV